MLPIALQVGLAPEHRRQLSTTLPALANVCRDLCTFQSVLSLEVQSLSASLQEAVSRQLTVLSLGIEVSDLGLIRRPRVVHLVVDHLRTEVSGVVPFVPCLWRG